MKTTRPTIANGKNRETDHSYPEPMPQPTTNPIGTGHFRTGK